MKIFSGLGSIFMLHRVAPYENGNVIYNENMKLSPDELESIIRELIENESIFISMDELVAALKDNQRKRNLIVFTLDDGYKDNIEYALPVFKKYNVPFCIYITNSFPNHTTNLWWYALENLILQNEILSVPNGQLENKTAKQKGRNFLRIRRQLIDHDFADPMNYLKQFGHLDFDLQREIADKCLSWHEIKELSKDPLVTIGCHTMNHYPLNKLTDRQARSEILDSKTELEAKIGKAVMHFAFPFGSRREAGSTEYKIAGSLGFDTVATAVHGHIYNKRDLLHLRRIFLFPLKNNFTTLNKVMYWNLKSFLSFLRQLI